MHWKAPLFGLITTASAFCGVPPASDTFRAVHASYANASISAPYTNVSFSAGIAGRATDPSTFVPTVTINTYVHVIYNTNSKGNTVGNINHVRITKQIAVLNRAFANTGFKFNLVGGINGINRIKNTAWLKLQDHSKAELQMKTKLRKGSYRDLNIYFTTLQDPERAGWTYFPDYPNLRGFVMDGVVISTASAPDGENTQHPDGKVACHEVGHWFGLLHTFEPDKLHPNNGCLGPGDYVHDTPAEKSSNRGCPSPNPNTCPSPGVDPIHSFMDYTNSKCMTTFTKGQVARMQALWLLYRADYDGPYENGLNEKEDKRPKVGFQ